MINDYLNLFPQESDYLTQRKYRLRMELRQEPTWPRIHGDAHYKNSEWRNEDCLNIIEVCVRSRARSMEYIQGSWKSDSFREDAGHKVLEKDAKHKDSSSSGHWTVNCLD